MILHREDIQDMLTILEKFPDVNTVEVQVDHSSGIGSITTMSFDTTVNETQGKFTIKISGEESW